MAELLFGVNDPLTNKIWSKTLAREALKETYFARFMGTGSSALIHEKTETKKATGDRVRFGLRMQLSDDGVQGNEVLEGNEEDLTFYYDDLVIEDQRHAVRMENRMNKQRVPYDLRMEAKDALKDWWADRIDTSIFNHLGGYTVQSNTRFTGNNAVTAPSTGRKLYVAGSQDQSQTASNVLTLSMIDKARELAVTASPTIRPVRISGEDYYVLFIHPYQTTDLRTTTSTGQWLDIQKAAMQGGKISDNPIFTGALGVYNKTVLHESTRVPQGVHSSTGAAETDVRRAIFAGAQAAAIGFGKDGGPSRMDWNEEDFDYGKALGVAASSIWGCKKTVFNSTDFGVVTISSYAVAST